MTRERFFKRVFAPLLYRGRAREAILSIKYHSRIHLLSPLATLLAERITTKTDLIIPVPLHLNKLKERGFNQSALLAIKLSKILNIPFELNALRRVKETSPLYELSRRQRFLELKGAFEVKGKIVRDKKILLVDDVLTTGATVEEISKTLLSVGCSEVFVGSLCRG